MATELKNDYVIDPVINGLTDWVVTFPTKKPHVFTNRATGPSGSFPASSSDHVAVQPFWNLWDGEKACEPFAIQYWDREENTPTDPPPPGSFSPLPPATPPSPDPLFCAEVNLLSFNDGVDPETKSALNGSEDILLGLELRPGWVDGWAELTFDSARILTALPLVEDVTPGADTASVPARELSTAAAGAGTRFFGLPAVGFAVIKYNNSVVLDGALLNYAGAHKHKVVTSIL